MEPDERAKSFVYADPADVVSSGNKIRFSWYTPVFGASTPTFARPSNWEMFQGSLLAVVFSTPTTHKILGSAIMVAPGVAFSTGHVFEDDAVDIAKGSSQVTCVGITSHKDAEAWGLTQVTSDFHTDVCILSLRYQTQLPAHRSLHHACISTCTPALNERLFMAGFRAGQEEFARNDQLDDELEAGLLVSHGIVTDHCPDGRGDSRPSPAVAVECGTIGGMSVGPVFDSRGLLVGVISESFNMGAGQSPSPTFVALLWPMLTATFPGTWPRLIGVAEGSRCSPAPGKRA